MRKNKNKINRRNNERKEIIDIEQGSKNIRLDLIESYYKVVAIQSKAFLGSFTVWLKLLTVKALNKWRVMNKNKNSNKQWVRIIVVKVFIINRIIFLFPLSLDPLKKNFNCNYICFCFLHLSF